MKHLTTIMICLLYLLLPEGAEAQALRTISPTSGANTDDTAYTMQALSRKTLGTDTLIFDQTLAPFYHGVASGDPLHDRVIIWTRVTPPGNEDAFPVEWKVATDVDMNNVVQSGTFDTDASRDFTVKVDVTGLEPGTTYYYVFKAFAAYSLVGKTKTTPQGAAADHLRFAVVSCQNYEGGYYNAYHHIAERTDLDAVIHLGDYIYEYITGAYGQLDELSGDRSNEPTNEILTLADYRTRYSLYRLDPNLRKAHQQHPFITVWDDHEFANDSYEDGAQNHTPGIEGDWEERKAIARQVYSEWLPLRGDASQIYRHINYGDLMDLYMVDTRIEARDTVIEDITNPDVYLPERTALGVTQREWLLDGLSNSQAKWKVIGNQIIFSPFNAGFATHVLPLDSSYYENIFMDIWDGYPAERTTIMNHIGNNNIDNVVILTGDFHCGFGFDVVENPFSITSYNPETGAGSIAVEFATPSISSANFNENLTPTIAVDIQACINTVNPDCANYNPNPHMKFANILDHGYTILDVTDDKVQADWYFVNTILEPMEGEAFAEAWLSNDGDNHLSLASGESTPKAVQDTPAPDSPLSTGIEQANSPNVTIMSIYPNPAADIILVSYVAQEREYITAEIVDIKGSTVLEVVNAEHAPNVYSLSLDVSSLPAGVYQLRFSSEKGVSSKKVVIAR